MTRKLASIQRILKLEPIPEADAIEKATVLGWQLVTKKGEFKEGDLCVYFEIDSLLPERPEFEFLKPRGMRIKTIRLRGQVSQGICFPLSVLPAGVEIEEGKDVTAMIGVRKYDPPVPACLSGHSKGPFPGSIPKTDETRIQVLQPVLTAFSGIPHYLTEKLDGSSVTYAVIDGEFLVCSRNMNLREDDRNTLWKIAREQQLEELLRSLGKNIALQGEVIGENIQSNKYKLKGQHVYFFNLCWIDEYRYADFEEFQSFFAAVPYLKTVPVVNPAYCLEDHIPTLVELSRGPSQINAAVPREGIVFRPLTEQSTALENLGRVSFKAVNPDFLLKYGE